MNDKYKIGLLGCEGFVGKNLAKIFKKKKIVFFGLNRSNHKDFIGTNFDFLINAAMPSKRFWAKNNPKLDYVETVEKTIFFCNKFKFKKFIHISSVSARCQLNTIYGENKKKSEDIVLKDRENLILRLGPMYGENLDKGVLIDMLKSKKVYIDGASKYSFTDINWIGKWLVDNINKYSGVKEIGSKDSITLSELARKINSTSTFEGLVDNQLIEDLEEYDSKSNYVYKFLNDFKKHETI